jgi:putative methyltransferase (TIGR01177 family)
MIVGFVEVSQESPALAEAEAVAAAEALGGGAVPAAVMIPGLVAVKVPDPRTWTRLAGRLGLARRCLVEPSPIDDPVAVAHREGKRGGSAAFRRLGEPSGGGVDEGILACGRAFKAAGGRIDLETPARRFWIGRDAKARDHLLEEVASVDRGAPALRKMPFLPFQRPVSLPPKLARAAMNLAGVKPRDRVLDPFLGTGALIAEAGLLGGRLYGVDQDPVMVRGALQNLAHLGLSAEELIVGDARTVEFSERTERFDAIVTDPPYGRSSSTGGEAAQELAVAVVTRWTSRLASAGRIVVIVPSGGPPLPFPGQLRFRIPVRVHRSLTRVFCVFEPGGVRRSEN